MNEKRNLNVMINKVGAKSEASVNYRISIPNAWAKHLEITKDSREVEVELVDNEIIIRKIDNKAD